MKSAFGGVCLAAVIVTANSRLFPAAWAIVDSENEANCVWFAEQFLSCFSGIDFVDDRSRHSAHQRRYGGAFREEQPDVDVLRQACNQDSRSGASEEGNLGRNEWCPES